MPIRFLCSPAHGCRATLLALLLSAFAVSNAVSEEKAHWGYSGETGPNDWGDLDPAFEQCKTGQMQSPVDVRRGARASNDLRFDYGSTPLTGLENHHTLQVDYSAGSYIQSGGRTYELLQLHFHSPSEHTLRGRHADMELHLVHRHKDGQLAVVGVMMRRGAFNPVIETIWSALKGDRQQLIDASGLLPRNKGYYSYQGSLTTPPCSEDVLWHVMARPIYLSKDQIEAFRQLHPMNARPVQPLNQRVIHSH